RVHIDGNDRAVERREDFGIPAVPILVKRTVITESGDEAALHALLQPALDDAVRAEGVTEIFQFAVVVLAAGEVLAEDAVDRDGLDHIRRHSAALSGGRRSAQEPNQRCARGAHTFLSVPSDALAVAAPTAKSRPLHIPSQSSSGGSFSQARKAAGSVSPRMTTPQNSAFQCSGVTGAQRSNRSTKSRRRFMYRRPRATRPAKSENAR